MSLSHAKSRPFGASDLLPASPTAGSSDSETESSGWLASSFDLKLGLDVFERPLDSLPSDQLEALIQQAVNREQAASRVNSVHADQRRNQRRREDRS
ncbi:hypothetical protein C1M51_17955 [Methylibium sp. Pch-M]|uniref:hypothetical protein n=1 Tax=Methylibium sp. Pch-M TaxID=2082386 RepID=UPI001012AAEC|nr:hypothetical protein [Methylibium sp. Pch-M]QAZ41150.1 hypothetical protein C1M51_17955 [Methylibium sp. Pch-M]